ncbi:hypothetical protein BCR36DRAFT_409597 [Piromyces finnis]|uniref:Carbohydrate-binding domain-containing protein n=1 Tax=Piromyces finnis TaxID=1754191 RepID=A0A1Y1VJC4_9FUNG|nr:hypothetical protein BCR36DRAFT_409597 [Piromyces finnis]|eukprot:ORX57289.1 hypothetical protein BCR36DRAFT_409597 [Piromyces finnis]
MVKKEKENQKVILIPGPITGKYSEYDLDESYNKSDIFIECSGSNITCNNPNVTINNNKVTISSAGTYILQGELKKQLFISANENDFIHLILNSISISSECGPAIYEKKCKNLVITSVGENILSDTTNYPKDETKKKNKLPNSCIFSCNNLSINGKGSLTIFGHYDEGIRCKKDLKLISSTINVTSKGKGIKAKNSISIKSANINIEAGDSAIKATEDTDPEKGFVVVDGGKIEIKAGNDGIHAESHLTINDGYINIIESKEGLEGQMIDILGGEIHVNANDDGINASKIGAVNNDFGPPFGVPEGQSSFEQSPFNKRNENNSDFIPPPPPPLKHNSEDNKQVYINIIGGKVYVKVEGNDVDGIDSNGNLYIGGKAKVYVSNGDGDIYGCMAALDADGDNIIDKGATVIATGSGIMSPPGGPGGPGGPPPFGRGGPGGPGVPPPFGRGGPGGPGVPSPFGRGGPGCPGGPPPFGRDSPGCPGGPPPFEKDGSGDSRVPPMETGSVKQPNIQITVDLQKAYTELTVKDKNDNVIITHKPETSYSKILISTPKLIEGEEYTIKAGNIIKTVIASGST